MNEVYEKLLKCYACFEDKIDFKPQAALILGSGLGDYADTNMKVEAVLDYHDIEGFPVSTVPGHKGRFVFGYVGDVPVVCIKNQIKKAGSIPASPRIIQGLPSDQLRSY